MRKVSFVGAGAIGSMLGGLLRHANPQLEVLLVGRGEHLAAMAQRSAVELVGPWGLRSVPISATDQMADIADSDVVFVTVKSHGTTPALTAAQPHLGNATVVSIQNGINDHRFLPCVARERLVMGMTTTNIAVMEAGRVSLQLDGATLLGGPDGDGITAATKQVAELLAAIRVPGLQFEAHPQVLGARYNKLMINALGYASCVSNSNFMNEALAYPPWRRGVAVPILAECRRVLASANVELAPLPGRSDVSRVERLVRLLDWPVVGWGVATAVRRRFQRQPILFSLGEDLRRGRQTEVDCINGEVVRLAKASGVSAPVNQAVVDMVHELEQRGARQWLSRSEVVDRVASAINA